MGVAPFIYGIVGWVGPTYRTLHLLNSSVTPQQYGAKADGVTDDSAAILAAVNTGKDVYFPDGDYLVGSTIVGQDLKHQTLFGLGNATLKLADNRSLGTQILKFHNCWNTHIRGLKFNGNKANQTQPPDDNGWNSGAPRIYFTPVTVENCVKFSAQGCEFYDSCTVCLNITGSQQVHVRFNHFHDSYMDALFANTIDLGNINEYIWVHGNLIEDITYRDGNGDIINRYGNGILLNASHLEITGNTIRNIDRTGLKPIDNYNMHDIYVAGNKITNCDWQGINPQAGYDINIENNEIEGSGWNGILIGSSEEHPVYNIDIKNNTITNSGIRDIGEVATNQDGILVTAGTYDINVEDNTITDCGRFGYYLNECHDAVFKNNTVSGVLGQRIVRLYAYGDPLYNVTLENETLIGQSGNQYGIDIADTVSAVTFKDCTISNVDNYGIGVGYNSTNILIDGCTITNSAQHGIWLYDSQNITIRNFDISYCTLEGVLINNLGTTGDPIDNVLIEDGVLDNIGRWGIRPIGLTTNEVEIDEPSITFTNIGTANISWV